MPIDEAESIHRHLAPGALPPSNVSLRYCPSAAGRSETIVVCTFLPSLRPVRVASGELAKRGLIVLARVIPKV
jgi:hypothetical protein